MIEAVTALARSMPVDLKSLPSAAEVSATPGVEVVGGPLQKPSFDLATEFANAAHGVSMDGVGPQHLAPYEEPSALPRSYSEALAPPPPYNETSAPPPSYSEVAALPPPYSPPSRFARGLGNIVDDVNAREAIVNQGPVESPSLSPGSRGDGLPGLEGAGKADPLVANRLASERSTLQFMSELYDFHTKVTLLGEGTKHATGSIKSLANGGGNG